MTGETGNTNLCKAYLKIDATNVPLHMQNFDAWSVCILSQKSVVILLSG